MRKSFFRILCLALTVLCCCGGALAATGTTEYSLGAIYATLSLSDSYIVLQPGNLAQHPEMLASLNKTEEDVLADWTERGVLLQAWVPAMDACLEVSAVQDEDAATYFDIDAQSTQARTAYRTSHMKGEKYVEMGYDFKASEWKRSGNSGRFLQIKYKRVVNGLTTWGYMDKTVRNGWTVTLDYQVYGRGLKEKDLNSLNKVLKTVNFNQTAAIPETAQGVPLTFTAEPPKETSRSTFTIEGTTTPGAHLIAVAMKYANPTPSRFEATASSNTGKFKIEVKLPSEGIWLTTLTVEKDGVTLAEEVFETTTYQSTLIPVTLDTEVPEQFSGDEFVLSGVTTNAVSIQCIVNGGSKPYDKTVRTNNSGKFSFKIPTGVQNEYDITLVFQKKNYETRRMTWTANRTLTEQDIQNQYKAEAVKPAYSTLTKKLDAYTGRVMGYKVYITDIQQVGDEYIIYAALTKTNKGQLKNTIVIVTDEEPNFVVGSEQKFYGRLTGLYELQSEEDTTGYPSFDLLFWE